MFNLIIRSFEWGNNQAIMPVERMFEYTEDHIAEHFKQGETFALDRLTALPCLFMPEGINDEIAHVGRIIRARVAGKEVSFEFALDAEVPPLQNSMIYANRMALDIRREFEFSRNHWAVKEIDLYRFLLSTVRPRRQRPSVFQIPEHENIEPGLTSAMMPFDASFNTVYDSIRLAAANVNLQCMRADDIWEHAAIIQDVVSLIDRSRVVVCDCTGRNPNVFYEAGIAHTLGRVDEFALEVGLGDSVSESSMIHRSPTESETRSHVDADGRGRLGAYAHGVSGLPSPARTQGRG